MVLSLEEEKIFQTQLDKLGLVRYFNEIINKIWEPKYKWSDTQFEKLQIVLDRLAVMMKKRHEEQQWQKKYYQDQMFK